MSIRNYCPNCGNEIENIDDEFCSNCGYQLNAQQMAVNEDFNQPNGFFDNLTNKGSFPIIIFSFIITAIFLFIGSFIWGILLSSKIINLFVYLFLTLGFASFFGGIFIGITACKDKTYITPNFLLYIGTIIAIVLGGSSLMFVVTTGLVALLGSTTAGTSTSSDVNAYANSYYSGSNVNDYSTTTPDTNMFSVISSLGFNLLLLIILIPAANYLGISLGYYLKENI